MGLSWLSQRNLVLVLVLVIMVSSSALELTGDNVCHRLENYTISVTESYMEPVVVNTFTWCLQIPPRCPKSRVEMRERWRIKTEIRQRKTMECCEGYAVKTGTQESAGMKEISECEPHCDICEYGNCIAPNICICEPGHRGDGCTSECPSGTWGEKCSRECNCQPNHICNPIDGKCHCPPGWQGSSCNEKCPAGKWGVDCDHSCVCNEENFGTDHLPLARQELAAFCHHETGSCINFHQIIVPSVPRIIMTDRFESEKDTELDTSSSTTASILSSSKQSTEADRAQTFNLDQLKSHADGYSVDKVTNDQRGDRVTGESQESATKSSTATYNDQTFKSSKSIETSSGEALPDPLFPEISEIETTSVSTRIETIKYDNYNVKQRVERIDMKKPRIKKPSTSVPIVAVVHVSGNGSPDHDGPLIMTSVGAEKFPSHTVTMPLDVAALIVIGSIISLGLTTLAVLAILHIKSKLFETIRLSICDADKRDICNDTIQKAALEKGNSGRISSTGSSNAILACEYETPRCMIPEHRTLTRSRPASSVEVKKMPESNYSNDYPNIRLFSNLQELLEAHYDRPPSTFRPAAVFDVDGEHVYDEIPLQSSTTFSTSKRDS